MSSYEDFLLQCDSSALKIEFMHVINDETLEQSFVKMCNVYCTGNNFTLTNETYSTRVKGKAELRKLVAIAKKAKKGKFKLLRVNNSLGYTRLVYGFVGK